MDDPTEVLDVAIVGAGIGGIIALHYARQAGLRARAFDRAAACGGLWSTLPAWQDIQIAAADWTAGDVPIAGTFQPDICANIQAWVDRFKLAPQIELDTPVHARPVSGGWALALPGRTAFARHLIAATGVHNEPVVPAVRRVSSEVTELHACALRDPAQLKDRSVLVVGAGASALDLLDLAVLHGAAAISWSHRGARWFTPTRKPKAIAGSVRDFSRLQASGLTHPQQSAAIEAELRGRYAKFGIQDVLPGQSFDVLHHQLIPGRHRMLEHFTGIRRIAAPPERIEARTVTFADGATVKPDLLLWGTGYATNLSWIEVPALQAVRNAQELRSRTGGAVRSLDAPQLYFLGTGLEGIGSTSFNYALLCRSIMSHICGTADLGLQPCTHNINHFDLVPYLAARDPRSFSAGWDRQHRALQLETPDDQPYPIPDWVH
ncbi:MAG: FAD-dependent oxidoreductase [Proteobacteria bacterium]|nr:FAD-dependent oxidoreductase [Pseudomonadota bacterium]